MTTNNTVCREIQAYLDADFDLIPLKRDSKEPRDKGWQTREYTTEEIAGWDGNLGVRLKFDQLVIDADPRNYPPGRDVLTELIRDVGLDLTSTPCVETGGGGLHCYLTMPLNRPPTRKLDAYPGIDFKSIGSQVVAAGGVHPETGNRYRFFCGGWGAMPEDAPEAPAKLLERFQDAMEGYEVDGARDVGRLAGEGELEKLLGHLDVSKFRDHDDWLRLMMSCVAATAGSEQGREEFIAWSTGDPMYADHAAIIRKRWDSLRPEGPVTEATLYKYVLEAGGGDDLPPLPHDTTVELTELVRGGPLRFVTGDKAIGRPKPAAIIKDLVYEKQKTMIYSQAGMYKTSTIASVCCEFLKGNPTAKVLYLATEDVETVDDRLAAELRHHGPGVIERVVLSDNDENCTDEWDVTVAEHVDQLVEKARATTGLKVLVIDNLTHAVGGRDLSSITDVTEIVKGLRRITTALPGVGMIVAGHTPKNRPDQFYGSMKLAANFDIMILVERQNDNTIKLRHEKHRRGVKRVLGYWSPHNLGDGLMRMRSVARPHEDLPLSVLEIIQTMGDGPHDAGAVREAVETELPTALANHDWRRAIKTLEKVGEIEVERNKSGQFKSFNLTLVPTGPVVGGDTP